jgi:hypothetical protein
MPPLRPSCLISDEIAFVLLMAVVYFQVRYMMNLYTVKFRKEADQRDYKVKVMNWENHNALEKFASELASMRLTANDRIEPLEARFEALEGVFNELITAETTMLKTTTTRLRALLESGAHWGRKQQELQARVDEAAQREAAWQKAASWA